MAPDKNRSGFPVEVKELKEDGISDEPIEFPSYGELNKFLHRHPVILPPLLGKARKANAEVNTLLAVLLLNTVGRLMARITLLPRSMARR